MGYSTVLFGVDLDQIRTIVCDHDLTILEKAQSEDPDEFDSKLSENEPTVGEALKTILTGGEIDRENAHQYGYGFLLMCRVIGESLPDDDMISDLPPLELNSPLEQFRSPIDVPGDLCFPFISFLTADEVLTESQRLASIDLSYPNSEDIEEAREAYSNCIQLAAQKNLAIVTFYH